MAGRTTMTPLDRKMLLFDVDFPFLSRADLSRKRSHGSIPSTLLKMQEAESGRGRRRSRTLGDNKAHEDVALGRRSSVLVAGTSAGQGGASGGTRRASTLEDHVAPSRPLLEMVRDLYIPKGHAIHSMGAEEKTTDEFYSDKALLMRESLKFDPRVLETLGKLWVAIDTNKNGM